MEAGAAAATSNAQPPTLEASDHSEDVPRCVIKNFRPVVGTRYLYRCANPDALADRLADGTGTGSSSRESERRDRSDPVLLHPYEKLMLDRAGLVVDLRSEAERDADKFRRWTTRARGGAFRVVDRVDDLDFNPSAGSASPPRHVLLLDPLHPDLFMSYLERNWMSPGERMKSLWYKLVDGEALHDLRLDVLNRRGLLGLNQAVLETGGECLLEALQAIVVHLENSFAQGRPVAPVVIHCVQGKDRTGMVSMLCQAAVGVDDDTMADDYHLSERELLSGAAAVARAYPGKIDRRFFSGAPRQTMLETLAWIRERHGSIQGYLSAIGFDTSWRARLAAVLTPAPTGADEDSGDSGPSGPSSRL